MDLTTLRAFGREANRETVSIPIGRGADVLPYSLQWLLFKPQAHAIEPFEINRPARDINTQRTAHPGSK